MRCATKCTRTCNLRRNANSTRNIHSERSERTFTASQRHGGKVCKRWRMPITQERSTYTCRARSEDPSHPTCQTLCMPPQATLRALLAGESRPTRLHPMLLPDPVDRDEPHMVERQPHRHRAPLQSLLQQHLITKSEVDDAFTARLCRYQRALSLDAPLPQNYDTEPRPVPGLAIKPSPASRATSMALHVRSRRAVFA